MRQVRIGKDFSINWSIFRKTEDGREPYNLEGRDLSLRLQNAYRTEEVQGFAVTGNTIAWAFRGAEQKTLGTYSLILVENNGRNGMMTIDKVAAFELVAHTEQETGNDSADVLVEDVALDSEAALLPVRVSSGGGSDIVVDSALSSTSTNPVQNRVVTQALAGKQDAISDLATIRSNAAKGATALQSVPAEFVTESELSAKGFATTSQVSAKQDKLTSGSNIKTINGQSILGSGNITIEGGSTIAVDSALSETSTNPVQNKVITEQINGIAQVFEALETELAKKMSLSVVSQSSSTIASAQADTAYVITNTSAGDVKVSALAAPASGVLMARYMVMFTGATSLTLPSGVLWADGKVPTIDSSVHYELSIVGTRFGNTMVYKAILAGFKEV